MPFNTGNFGNEGTTDGRRQQNLAYLTFIVIGLMGSAAAAQSGKLQVDAGVASFEETKGLNLDMAFTVATIAPVWVSNPIKDPRAKGSVGRGQLSIETNQKTYTFETSSKMNVFELSEQINRTAADLRAAVLSTGGSSKLVITAASTRAPDVFEDTGTIHLPNSIVDFEDTGTIHITGGFGTVSFGQRMVSAPVPSATKGGSAGKGTLWLTVGDASVAVDISPKMSLRDVAAAINSQKNTAFRAEVLKTAAGYSLAVDASNPEVAGLFSFEDTGTIHVPGSRIAFEDTGTIHISGGIFSFEDTGTIHLNVFEDTGTIHTEGGLVFFEDTGTIHVPGGFFVFEDTGTIHIPGTLFSFEDTGTIHIELEGKLMF
jgi:hypothetical protein